MGYKTFAIRLGAANPYQFKTTIRKTESSDWSVSEGFAMMAEAEPRGGAVSAGKISDEARL